MRDLPIFEVPAELIVPRLRVGCERCGAKLERLAWLEGYSRVTTRCVRAYEGVHACSKDGQHDDSIVVVVMGVILPNPVNRKV